MVAYNLHLATLGPHGFPTSEATSSEADPNNRLGSFKFVADDVPTIDFVEKARRDAEDAYRENYKDANMNGLSFPVRKIER